MINSPLSQSKTHFVSKAGTTICTPSYTTEKPLTRVHAVSHKLSAPSSFLTRSRSLSLGRLEAFSQLEAETKPKTQTDDFDAIIIGAGMGGLTVASQLRSKGLRVLLLEKYLIPGGSAGYYKRDGFTFDVGSSMMFGFGKDGTTNLITKALEAVGKSMETVPDPTQIHYHLPISDAHPKGLEVFVWRDYEDFIANLTQQFPHESEGIRKFYDECWVVFNSLNVLELKSLEEPRYLLEQFSRHPIACLQLAARVFANTGEVARKFIKDEELLRFIDMECFCWSTVSADFTPLINSGMVFCDRHFGGINYPKGGVGQIAVNLAKGFEEMGGEIIYAASAKRIIIEDSRAVGVELGDGRVFRAKTIVSNATRWDTFEKLMKDEELPAAEVQFRSRYKQAPSFVSLHLGIKSDVLPKDTHCHHIILEDWKKLEDPRGTLFVSIPTVLDPSLAPEGYHIFHAFTPDWIDNYKGLGPKSYEVEKNKVADGIVERLDRVFPGLKEGIQFREVATPRTHRRFLGRKDGTYGPIPSRRPAGMMSMPFNTTSVDGLYCVGDSTFPGQGVNAVVFSGFGCAHRVMCDLGKSPTIPFLDGAFKSFLETIRANV